MCIVSFFVHCHLCTYPSEICKAAFYTQVVEQQQQTKKTMNLTRKMVKRPQFQFLLLQSGSCIKTARCFSALKKYIYIRQRECCFTAMVRRWLKFLGVLLQMLTCITCSPTSVLFFVCLFCFRFVLLFTRCRIHSGCEQLLAPFWKRNCL